MKTSPEASAMAAALAEHGKNSDKTEIEKLKEDLRKLRQEAESMQVQGGKVSWPVVQTADTGSRRSPGASAATANINVFVNGTLMVLPVYVASEGSSFGPF